MSVLFTRRCGHAVEYDGSLASKVRLLGDNCSSCPNWMVTIIVQSLGLFQTVFVTAKDEWEARTHAMRFCTAPLSGEHVTYDIHKLEEVSIL
jgi:hypothetical protein